MADLMFERIPLRQLLVQPNRQMLFLNSFEAELRTSEKMMWSSVVLVIALLTATTLADWKRTTSYESGGCNGTVSDVYAASGDCSDCNI